MVNILSISYYDQSNFHVNNQVQNPNNEAHFNDMTKVYYAAVAYHKKYFQSLPNMILAEHVVIQQVCNDNKDSSGYNICGGMLADSEFEVKEKTSKQAKNCNNDSRKKTEGRRKKVANLPT
eukprot:12608674-Ditylum_brightwellii.AAC.1